MQVLALPSGLSRFARSSLARQRWANGAGWTQPVAAATDRDGDLWRVSIAELTQAAPFSVFPNMDRTAVLLTGGPVSVQAGHEVGNLSQPGDLIRFAGEAPACNHTPQSSAFLWNVMTRRGACSAQVSVHRQDSLYVSGHRQVLVCVLAGQYQVQTPSATWTFTLGPGDGLNCHAQLALVLSPQTSDACLVSTELQHAQA